MEDPPIPSSNPRLRKPQKKPTKPLKEIGLRKNFMESFIKPALLQDQISQGNLKDVYEDLIDFKTTFKFEDKTFTEALNYSGSTNKNKKTAELIDKFLISSNEGEFFQNAAKLGSSVGVKKEFEVQPNQGFKDINKKLEEGKVKEKVEDIEEKIKTSVLEASKESKKEKQSEEDKDLELVGVGLPSKETSDRKKIGSFLSKMTDEVSKKVVKDKIPTPTPKPSATTGKIKAFTDKEIDDKMKELGVSKKEAIAQLKLAKKMEPPTFSPEEMPTAKEDIAEEKEAQARAKEMRSQPKPELMTEEVKEDVKMSISKSKDIEDPKPTGEAIAEPLETVGSLSDFIPPVRLVTKGKSSKDLLEDINFFIKNFPKQLENEKEILGRIDKNKITDVRKLHSRIVGKVRPSESKRNSKDGTKVGVVVNADTYIREKLKEILQEDLFTKLRPADVVIDVARKPTIESDSKDYGSFEVKSNAMGGLYAQREPIYRYLPSENDPNVGEKDLTRMEKKKTKRLELQKPKSWNIRNSTIRNYKKDPFKSKQKTTRLNYLD